MSNTIERTRGNIRVYACGGAGINLGRMVETISEKSKDNLNFAQIDITYVDTSLANAKGLPKDCFYHIQPSYTHISDREDTLDGSGQKRDENAESVKQAIPDLLLKHPPKDINILIHSGGGGSGSVLAPFITAQLKKKGLEVIIILIGSRDTLKDITNTIDTIKSYAGISKVNNSPIAIAYEENGSEYNNSRLSSQVVDSNVLLTVNSLAVLFSKNNERLDTKDLEHWLNFQKVTDYQPGIVGLQICDRNTAKDFDQNIVSVATLHSETSGTSLGSNNIPSYQCRGILPEELSSVVVDEDNNSKLPLHFILSDEIIVDSLFSLNKLSAGLKEKSQSRPNMVSLISDDDNASDDGIVL
ncbi:MAG: hypothetical protein M0R77_00800 [Gammaproteobacteria bacterium]|nr:hypothetical protein [Acholeplasmataceae bacterium]MCK9529093.1 hypothetical protein [Gammaproteobacteria bacterium]